MQSKLNIVVPMFTMVLCQSLQSDGLSSNSKSPKSNVVDVNTMLTTEIQYSPNTEKYATTEDNFIEEISFTTLQPVDITPDFIPSESTDSDLYTIITPITNGFELYDELIFNTQNNSGCIEIDEHCITIVPNDDDLVYPTYEDSTRTAEKPCDDKDCLSGVSDSMISSSPIEPPPSTTSSFTEQQYLQNTTELTTDIFVEETTSYTRKPVDTTTHYR